MKKESTKVGSFYFNLAIGWHLGPISSLNPSISTEVFFIR